MDASERFAPEVVSPRRDTAVARSSAGGTRAIIHRRLRNAMLPLFAAWYFTADRRFVGGPEGRD